VPRSGPEVFAKNGALISAPAETRPPAWAEVPGALRSTIRDARCVPLQTLQVHATNEGFRYRYCRMRGYFPRQRF